MTTFAGTFVASHRMGDRLVPIHATTMVETRYLHHPKYVLLHISNIGLVTMHYKQHNILNKTRNICKISDVCSRPELRLFELKRWHIGYFCSGECSHRLWFLCTFLFQVGSPYR